MNFVGNCKKTCIKMCQCRYEVSLSCRSTYYIYFLFHIRNRSDESSDLKVLILCELEPQRGSCIDVFHSEGLT